MFCLGVLLFSAIQQHPPAEGGKARLPPFGAWCCAG
jgi:hypothetical protein